MYGVFNFFVQRTAATVSFNKADFNAPLSMKAYFYLHLRLRHVNRFSKGGRYVDHVINILSGFCGLTVGRHWPWLYACVFKRFWFGQHYASCNVVKLVYTLVIQYGIRICNIFFSTHAKTWCYKNTSYLRFFFVF